MLRRGFKAEAERIALETRAELGLRPADRLDPQSLAAHLHIPVVALLDLRALVPVAVDHLREEDPSCFSAATLFRGSRRVIVTNDSHVAGRRANSLAHELSHVILWHKPGPIIDEMGRRRWIDDDEEEADWLAGCLLVPRDGIYPVMSRLQDVMGAARHFGVSFELMRWRFGHTGVKIQMVRSGFRFTSSA